MTKTQIAVTLQDFENEVYQLHKGIDCIGGAPFPEQVMTTLQNRMSQLHADIQNLRWRLVDDDERAV